MTIRSQVSAIMGQIEPAYLELFALEFGKTAEYDFVYSLSSTNINQSAPNLVKTYVIIRSWMSLIMDLMGLKLSDLTNQHQTWPQYIYMPIRSQMSLIMGQIEPAHSELFALNSEKLLNMTLIRLYHLQL